MPSPTPPASTIFLSGPTGAGKSAIALALGEKVGNAAIVNADAFQLYRGYEILSAAPSEEDRSRLPHFLYGHLDLWENCDAARFTSLALPLLHKLNSDGVTPIVVGGSGLYLKALTHGLAPTPPGNPELRGELDQLSLDALVERYQQLDPEGASRTNLKNRRYVTRNVEISLITGRPASEVKKEFATPEPNIRAVFIDRDREDLYDRINRRTLAMFREGVVEEIRHLENSDISVTAEKAIGFRDLRSHLRGEIDQETVTSQIQQSTRRYAKRQRTWFRREKAFQSVCLGPEETPDSAADRIFDLVFPD